MTEGWDELAEARHKDMMRKIDAYMADAVMDLPMTELLTRMELVASRVVRNLTKGHKAYDDAHSLHQGIVWMLDGAILEQAKIDQGHSDLTDVTKL